jgi:hypothetical protein
MTPPTLGLASPLEAGEVRTDTDTGTGGDETNFIMGGIPGGVGGVSVEV